MTTLLLIGFIPLLRCEVRMMGQRIKFPLLTPKVICDDKLKSGQGQCPPSLALIQNTSCHEILQIFMV
jgi:hypothetical protein